MENPYPGTQTGLADMDEIISNLHASSIDTRRRIDSERTLAADVSHQLRSPLAALSLRIEQVADGAEGTKVQDDAQAALGQIDRLVKLVEGLLSTWRETANRELSPIDIEEFLGTNAARWQTRFSNEGRALKVEIEPGLIALGTVDVQNLVISILLENSLQFGIFLISVSKNFTEQSPVIS